MEMKLLHSERGETEGMGVVKVPLKKMGIAEEVKAERMDCGCGC